MSIVIGLDVGTTTITALALDAERGAVLSRAMRPNDTESTRTSDVVRGRSEWDAERIFERSLEVIREAADGVGTTTADVVGIGMTGQQHGVVLVDTRRGPLTPFIGWKDRRGLECVPGGRMTYAAQAEQAAGRNAAARRGCRLATGFMGVTLFWMRETGVLSAEGTACFVTDYLGARLTGAPPVTDPTMGASSGLFDLATRCWDEEAIRGLGLPRGLFPDVREAGDRFGVLTSEAGRATRLRAGLPVYVGVGDNQASFLGSVADRSDTVQVNIGTGGQVGLYTDRVHEAPFLETRPFPRAGYLLVAAGLCGGRAYATLRQFFEQVGAEMFPGVETPDLYAVMNSLAAAVPRGAGGLSCEPFFTGSRAEPERRANWTGISEENFSPAHMVRALLEGMARSFCDGYGRIRAATGGACGRLVGAGNGIRENPVLARIIAEEFGLPLAVPVHREEAAFGAALTAAAGAGILPDLTAGGRLIRYHDR